VSPTNSIDDAPQRNGTRPYPPMLPEWAIRICRPIIGLISRLFWRVHWRDTEHIPASGGVIIAANHQTYIDPFWVGVPVRRPIRFLAWDAAFSWPVIGYFLKLFGAWPLQLEGSDPAPIRRSLQWIGEGGAVMLFPEGGRGNPDGSMKKCKAGAVRMAIEAGVPILPVTIRGGQRVWPNTVKLPRIGRSVEVIYHPLMRLEPAEAEGTREFARRETERLAGIISSAL
jgi:1-acyl-sn-glycerol-3-phosphate acyltransferase